MPETTTSPARMPAPIRNEPVQARSAARLTALLDATASVIAEIGYERLTTAMVADRAGASIGTVYRYFPDRIAVLQSLAARNEERVTAAVLSELGERENWRDALATSFDVYAGFFRSEPGFASLRLGDVLDLRPAEGEPRDSVFANRIFDVLVDRFGLVDDPEARFAFDAGIAIMDGLIARAFAGGPDADERYLELARETVRSIGQQKFATR